jgi:hypothetical protein
VAVTGGSVGVTVMASASPVLAVAAIGGGVEARSLRRSSAAVSAGEGSGAGLGLAIRVGSFSVPMRWSMKVRFPTLG